MSQLIYHESLTIFQYDSLIRRKSKNIYTIFDDAQETNDDNQIFTPRNKNLNWFF